MKVIIYKDDSNKNIIISPSKEALAEYTLEEIAKMQVPKNTVFEIVDVKDIQNKPSKEQIKQKELAELEEQIKETEGYIRHAILIGNDSVLPELREEYKELLTQKENLTKGDEQ